MILYDFNEIEKVYFCGDIHGEFKTFFNVVKRFLNTNVTVEEELHELELKYSTDNNEPNNRLIASPIDFNYSLDNPNKSYNNSVIIVCGDCGIGFNKYQYYIDLFSKYNKVFQDSNTTILFIRGNHDDPSYFDGEKINFSHIKAIQDYSVVTTKQLNVLCIGGAISVDRIWRKQKEITINKYHTSITKKLYWEDEDIILDYFKLQEIIDSNIKINAIATHTAPSWAKPIDKNTSISWLRYDDKLKNDLFEERHKLDTIFNILTEDEENNIKYWFYGHFHKSFEELNEINNKKIITICLNDTMVIKNHKEVEQYL